MVTIKFKFMFKFMSAVFQKLFECPNKFWKDLKKLKFARFMSVHTRYLSFFQSSCQKIDGDSELSFSGVLNSIQVFSF